MRERSAESASSIPARFRSRAPS
eukprot:gene26442-biopygen16478